MPTPSPSTSRRNYKIKSVKWADEVPKKNRNNSSQPTALKKLADWLYNKENLSSLNNVFVFKNIKNAVPVEKTIQNSKRPSTENTSIELKFPKSNDDLMI